MLKDIWESEVNTSMKEIYEEWAKNKNMLVEMKRWVGYTTLNVVCRMIIGKRFEKNEGNDQCQKKLRDLFELRCTFVVAYALPYLRWLDLGGHERAMKELNCKSIGSCVLL